MEPDSQMMGLLHTIRDLTASITTQEAELSRRRAALDAEEVATLKPLRDLRQQLLGDVAAWLGAHRDKLGEARSVTTAHGRLGVRVTAPKVRFLKGQDFAAAVLRARGLTEAFVVREELSVDALRRLSPAELRQAGVTFERGEVAYLRLPDGTLFPLEITSAPEAS